MRRAGWVARRHGPPLRHHPVAAGPSPRLERYGGALSFPDGSAGLNAGVRGLWYKSFPPSQVRQGLLRSFQVCSIFQQERIERNLQGSSETFKGAPNENERTLIGSLCNATY
jgi:hypothetical protein